ncbi:hypothetical protein GINT2_001883 [Glugoides intestinalis]
MKQTHSEDNPSIKMKNKVTKAVILVGGWGTRLRPLTYTVPKPLVAFCNKPILKYQIEKLVKAGITEIILALNYHSEKIIGEVQKYEEEFGIKIIYSKEDEPLGTAGPLALVRDQLKDTSFFVLNSDIFCNADLKEMKEEYERRDSSGMLLVFGVENPTKYGLIKLEGKRITSFLEKPKNIEGNGPWLINAGVYVLHPDVLDIIELRNTSIEHEVFPKLVEGGRLDAFVFEGYWMDIGQPRDYLEGQMLAIKAMKKSEVGIDIENNVVIGKDVRIGKEVTLQNCTLFDNTVIEDNVTIKDSIIGWRSHIYSNSKILDYSILGEGTVIESGICVKNHTTEPNTRIKKD